MTTSISDSGIQLASGNIIDLRTAIPTTGSYVIGDIILESTSGNRISGWKRQTTGTGNVLGTDWIYFSSGSTLIQANQTPLPGVNTVISYTHGLGVIPIFAELEIVCLTAELGYAVGDVVTPCTGPSASYNSPFSLAKNTTTIYARTGASASFVLKNASGGDTAATPANWAWRFKVRVA